MGKKTRILLGLSAAILLGTFLIPRSAQGQPVAAPKSPVEIPAGMECVVTVEMQSWMSAAPLKPDAISGFHPDYTLREKVVHWGPDWIVLKDGTYENWISRDKVLSVRVSR